MFSWTKNHLYTVLTFTLASYYYYELGDGLIKVNTQNLDNKKMNDCVMKYDISELECNYFLFIFSHSVEKLL